jgi:hypothetical protein
MKSIGLNLISIKPLQVRQRDRQEVYYQRVLKIFLMYDILLLDKKEFFILNNI